MIIQSGAAAPPFKLESVQGSIVSLADYKGKSNVLLWFSRGFACAFCRAYMTQLQSAASDFRAQQTEVIQVSANVLTRARQYFQTSPLIFPYLCDPEKRLYSAYGLEDRGLVEAGKSNLGGAVYAAQTGQFGSISQSMTSDVLNGAFLQRLHHYALTAVEQGLILIDKEGIVRWSKALGPLENITDNKTLLETIARTCPPEVQPRIHP